MGEAVERLLAISSRDMAATLGEPVAAGRLGRELYALLERRNGFMAFESALRVFPGGPAAGQHTLAEWNAPGLWRDAYDGMTDDLVLFAEDIFGVQFAIAGDAVVTFDPETGERERMTSSLEGWAAAILDDPAVLTGHPLAHAWQRANGPIPVTQRLVPIVPFVLGGDFAVENLHALDAAAGMRMRGDLAVQLRDLPDGTTVTYGPGR